MNLGDYELIFWGIVLKLQQNLFMLFLSSILGAITLDRSANITTSDNEIVQVSNETHSIKALKEGEATVTISYVYFPDVIKEVKVVVSDMNTINISVGEEYKLMLNNIKDVQIDNPEVIESVDLSTIKGIAEGESALIIIDNNDNEIEITVIVKEK